MKNKPSYVLCVLPPPPFFSIRYCFVPHETFTVHKIENRIDKYLHFQIKHSIDYCALFPMDCFPKYRGYKFSNTALAPPLCPHSEIVFICFTVKITLMSLMTRGRDFVVVPKGLLIY